MEPDIGINFRVFLGSLVNAVPGLGVWIVALVLSIVLSKRSNSKLERFLVIGSCLMLVKTILSIPKQVITDFLRHSSLSNFSAAAIISEINLFLGLISLAGVICLFYAACTKFNERAKVIVKD
jgi:hypothetical protein